MAFRIEEFDLGTKPKTRKKLLEMKNDTPKKWRSLMNRYWYKVYENCVQAITDMGAVDTGALRDSIRLEQNIAPIGIKHEVIRTGDADESVYLVAGGGGYINPKKNTEVDYASAVHDGYFRKKSYKKQWKMFNLKRKKNKLKRISPAKSIGTSVQAAGWIAGRPFLDEGIKRTEQYLEELLNQYGNDISVEWEKDQPLVNPYSLPLLVTQGRK